VTDVGQSIGPESPAGIGRRPWYLGSDMPGAAVCAGGLTGALEDGLAGADDVPAVSAGVVGAGVVGAGVGPGGVGPEIPGPTQPVSTSRPATSALPSLTVLTLLARGAGRRGCTDPSPSSQAEASSLRAAAAIRSSVAVSATRTNWRPASP